MSIEKAKRLLGTDPKEAEESLLFALEQLDEISPMIIERKDRNLAEVIERLLKEGRFPLVDKKLRMVFGVAPDQHSLLRGSLYCFHTAHDPSKQGREYQGMGPDNYIHEGMGYCISSMHSGRVVVGERYMPDKQDKDLFMLYDVAYVPEGIPVWKML